MYQELVKFIEEYLVKGFTRDEIRQALIKNGGWTNADLDQAFKEVTIVSAPPIPKPNISKDEPIGIKSVQPEI